MNDLATKWREVAARQTAPPTSFMPGAKTHVAVSLERCADELELWLKKHDVEVLAPWKKAIEGLTPSGSEFVNDPAACAAYIRKRTNYPPIIIKLRERVAELEQQVAEVPAKARLEEAKRWNEYGGNIDGWDEKRIAQLEREAKVPIPIGGNYERKHEKGAG